MIMYGRMPNESNFEYFDKLEKIIKAIIHSSDTSVGAMKALAYALMEIPGDIDHRSDYKLFLKSKEFLMTQTIETRLLFKRECEALPCKTNLRISLLLMGLDSSW